MRLCLVLVISLLCFLTSTSALNAPEQQKEVINQKIEPSAWIKIEPKGEGFTVLMPGTPKELASEIVIASMKIPTLSYSLTIGETGFFAQKWGDFPEQLVNDGYLDAVFDRIQRVFFEMTEKDGTKSLFPFTRTDIVLDGKPGHEYQAACGPYKKVSGPCNTKIRVYKVGRSLYIVGTAGPTSAQLDEDTRKFFSSLTILN